MDGRMDTPTDADILTLAQWFSPAWPVGSFAYSHGLEWLVECGDIRGRDDLRSWLEDVIEHGAGRTDAIFLGAAFKAEDESGLAEIDAAARAGQAAFDGWRRTPVVDRVQPLYQLSPGNFRQLGQLAEVFA